MGAKNWQNFVNIVGILSLKGNNNILTFKHLNMYLHIEIRHDLLIQCCGNYIGEKIQ